MYWLLTHMDELLKNLALLYTLTSLLLGLRQVQRAFATTTAGSFRPRLLVFAALAALTMAFPLSLTCLAVDLRLSVLMLSALYLGPLGSTALAAGTVAVSYLMGGPGWALATVSLLYGPVTYLASRVTHRRLTAILTATLVNLAIFVAMLAILSRFYHPYIEISPWTNPASLLVLVTELALLVPLTILMLDTIIRQRIHDYRRQQDLERQAHVDAITGLYNHRHLQEILDRLLPRASAEQPCSFLMLDVDYFKNYNDTFGHQQGDALLKELAELFRRTVRPVDFVARYGGEEFAIVLPHVNGEAAVQVAERLRAAVTAFPAKGRELMPGGCISVSIGIATYPHDASDKDGLLAAADEALYIAKNISRNRVERYAPLFAPWQDIIKAADMDALMDARAILIAANSRDHFIYGHSLRVMRLAKIIGSHFTLTRREQCLLHVAAFLHDLGRVRLMHTAITVLWEDAAGHHARQADRWLNRVRSLPELIPIVERHHARYDQPDPSGRTPPDIIRLSRIIHVADTYDLLLHGKITAPGQNALDKLARLRGTVLDPAATEALLQEIAAC